MIKLIGKYLDPDQTEKFVFKDLQGTIEITRIKTKIDRDIFCVPTAYGCSLGCSFCFLTTLNVSKTNKPIEWSTIKECLKQFDNKKDKRQISLMGAGDPALNIKFIKDCSNEEEMVSISTIFPIMLPELNKNVKIHYSLHSIDQSKRNIIMPAAKVSILDAIEYLVCHNGNKEIHYTLIENENDSDEELELLINLSKKYKLPIKFLHFKESGENKTSLKLNKWLSELSKVTFVEFYAPPGASIQGSCGQFTHFFYKEGFESSDEFKEYNKKYAF